MCQACWKWASRADLGADLEMPVSEALEEMALPGRVDVPDNQLPRLSSDLSRLGEVGRRSRASRLLECDPPVEVHVHFVQSRVVEKQLPCRAALAQRRYI